MGKMVASASDGSPCRRCIQSSSDWYHTASCCCLYKGTEMGRRQKCLAVLICTVSTAASVGMKMAATGSYLILGCYLFGTQGGLTGGSMSLGTSCEEGEEATCFPTTETDPCNLQKKALGWPCPAPVPSSSPQRGRVSFRHHQMAVFIFFPRTLVPLSNLVCPQALDMSRGSARLLQRCTPGFEAISCQLH